jgi:hypothetical protein
MRVLIACEESQTVCKAFRAKGHEAYSCDILPCSGGHPEWHYQQDVKEILWYNWDLVIAHPPCTRLANSGVRWLEERDLFVELKKHNPLDIRVATLLFKRGVYKESIQKFINECTPYYHLSKRKYLEKKLTFNSFTTILRQICNFNKISYTSQIKYDKSNYCIEYYIYI